MPKLFGIILSVIICLSMSSFSDDSFLKDEECSKVILNNLKNRNIENQDYGSTEPEEIKLELDPFCIKAVIDDDNENLTIDLQDYETNIFDKTENLTVKDTDESKSGCHNKNLLGEYKFLAYYTNASSTYKCNFCHTFYTSNARLKKHIKQNHRSCRGGGTPDLPPFKCDICQVEFQKKSILSQHNRRKHPETCEFTCECCKKKFADTFSLKRHRMLHLNPFKCDVCDKTFFAAYNLKTHQRIHNGERPYACNVCQKTFNQSSGLNKHKRIHSGEKPYQCSICLKSFGVRFNLKVHMRTHSGEKPYECDICHKMFSHQSYIKQHKRCHTGEKPFECDICNKFFANKTILRGHIKIHMHKILVNKVKKSY
ncbi:zinc finger protein 501-like isoform X2 [Daktulosphaira vitifoliae]|uniref:zinc finger protein 501-like isoform X2 n=1 Tax=Daktulosphaira vitifoliae TaxID=58002 RepID=UPI0021AA4619|nr:zinc finger protein 501-like isoform X2 [Daktulosphaira vitifoliae]